ncbi:MAG: aspartate/glutamate racemase family protein [Streptosporangiaceae bacterium]
MTTGPSGASGGQDTAIGVICLDTSFTKIPGHIRNRATFGFPVVYDVVPGATPQRVVTEPDPALLQPFIESAVRLEAAGVSAITSACGFLALFQAELAGAVTIPVYASSLLQVPMVHRMLAAGQQVGILTASASSLSPAHLAGAGAGSVPVCIAGLAEQPEFRAVILEGKRDDLDPGRLGREVVGVAEGLLRAHPDVGALVLECTDLVPFAHEIQARTGLPVFDIVTLTGFVHASLSRRPFPAPAAVSSTAGTL